MKQIALWFSTTRTRKKFRNGEFGILTEIGCIELIDRKITERRLHLYTNPDEPVLDEVVAENLLDNDFLADKPSTEVALIELAQFLSGAEDLLLDSNASKKYLQGLFDTGGHSTTLPKHLVCVDELLEAKASLSDELPVYCDYRFDSTADKADAPRALHGAATITQAYLEATSDEVLVTNFAEFHSAVEGISRATLCRGVSDKSYELVPSLFRGPEGKNPNIEEYNLLWLFKTQARPHLDAIPQSTLEWLVVAQHHGLPTRLLDWSLSPLVAAFFAVQKHDDLSGAVYVFDAPAYKKEEELDLSQLTTTSVIMPSHTTRRVTAQFGMFTVHPTNERVLRGNRIRKIIIPAKYKAYFREVLAKYGVNAATMFPDLDGLCRYIRDLKGFE